MADTNKKKEPMDAHGTPKKRDLSPEPVVDDTRRTVVNKKNKTDEQSAVDAHLKAVTVDFLNNEFEPKHPLNVDTREILIQFGIEMYKHITKKETINSVELLAKQMSEGFRQLNSKIDFIHGQVNEIQNEKEEEKKKEADKVSYAEMTKKLNTLKPKDEQIEPEKTKLEDAKLAKKFTVIELTNKVDEEGFQEVRSRLSKRLMGKQVRVDKIVKTNRGNISLEFPTLEDQKKVEHILSEAGNKPDGANLRSSTVKQIGVALRGIPSYLTEEEVKAHLKEWNLDHPFGFDNPEGWSLRLIKAADKRSHYQVGKIIAPLARAKTLLDNNWKVYVALTALKVEIWKPNHTRCAKCLRAGHTAKSCPHGTVCVICGGDHPKDDCRKKDRPDLLACVVCVREQKREFKHTATGKDCPILLAEQMSEYKKVFNFVHHG